MKIEKEEIWLGAWRCPELKGTQDEWQVILTDTDDRLAEMQAYKVIGERRHDGLVYVAILP